MMGDSEIFEFEKSMQLDNTPGLTYQSITDAESQKATSAYKEFEQKNLEEALKILKSLQSNRPQDAKVFHNISVTEFYLSKCCSILELYSSLLLICKQANVDVEDIDAIDDVDQCVLFFNRAVVLYHLHKYRGAIAILDKVFQFVEPLDEVLGRKICILLLELYLCTHQPKKALSLIGYIEATLLSGSTNKSNKSPEKDEIKGNSYVDELKMKLVQCKARCYTMMKTAKPCKREVKILMSSGSKARHIAAFVIKSQLEYQRGNYRKGIKILNSPEWPDDFSEYFRETGDCLQAMYYNNLSCIHYYMGKPALGSYYAEHGIKELDREIKNIEYKGAGYEFSPRALHTLSYAVRKKLIYNLGMQEFQQQHYLEAYKHLLSVTESYYDNPRLWLRIAECCIQIYWLSDDEAKKLQSIKDVVGSGPHKKVILYPTHDSPAFRQSNKAEEIDHTPNLSFAICALSNALMLLPKEQTSTETNDNSGGGTGTQLDEEKDVNPLEEKCLQCLPCNALPTADVPNLRNSILVALSYVSLKLGDLLIALDYAQQLLSQPRISEAHKFLAHMYAGEALVCLDKITQAIEHFKPEHFSDITLTMPPCMDETASKHQVKSETPERADAYDRSKLRPTWYPDSLSTARLIAQYNLTVLYAMRGEWSKALRLATEVAEDENAPSQIWSLMAYINLCRGATDVALSYLNKYTPFLQR